MVRPSQPYRPFTSPLVGQAGDRTQRIPGPPQNPTHRAHRTSRPRPLQSLETNASPRTLQTHLPRASTSLGQHPKPAIHALDQALSASRHPSTRPVSPYVVSVSNGRDRGREICLSESAGEPIGLVQTTNLVHTVRTPHDPPPHQKGRQDPSESVTYVLGLTVTHVPGLYRERARGEGDPETTARSVTIHARLLRFLSPLTQK